MIDKIGTRQYVISLVLKKTTIRLLKSDCSKRQNLNKCIFSQFNDDA